MSRAAALVAVVLLCGLLFLVFSRDEETFASGPCPAGYGWDAGLRGLFGDSAEPGGAAGELLDHPNFGASSDAAGDLEDGVVDERLVSALLAVSEEHGICVDAFKEGHYFLPGVDDGPEIPDGYGEAGGLPNAHYFGRAADIRWVEGDAVGDRATSPGVLGIGEALRRMPAGERPDQIIGPPSWTASLGYGHEEGWVPDDDQVELHDGHLHIGYTSETGTRNVR